jgi:hypothetical protein
MNWVKPSAVLFLPDRKRFNDGNIGDTAGVVIVTTLTLLQSWRLVKPSPRPCWAFLNIRASFAAPSRWRHRLPSGHHSYF